MINVLIIPFDHENPYHTLLSSSLRKQDISIIEGKLYNLFSLLKNIRLHNEIDIIQIEWSHPFFIQKNKFKAIMKAILFILDVIISRMIGVKIVWRVHNKYNHEGLHKRLDIFISRILVHFCDRVFVECKIGKEIIVSLFHIQNENKVKIIPMGTYEGSYENTITKQEARNQLNISHDEFVFLFLGNVRVYKGLFDLIDAFNKVQNRNTVRLLVAGKPYDQKLESELQEKIRWNDKITAKLSFIPDHDVQKYFKASDFAVYPYKDILSSGAILLALTFHKPIIAPKMGCIPDILDEQGSILYDPTDENGLLEALNKAISSDIKLMREYHSHLIQKFNWDEIAEKTCCEYTNLAFPVNQSRRI